jgi:hypothetical protein
VKTLPNFFIVGAARSGTTSLDRYLSQHPEIYVTPKKETHFFAREDLPLCSGPGDDRLSSILIRDEEEYARLFVKVKGEKAIGESSAFYLCFPGAAERIATTIPDAKILIILREPVERAYSSYMFMFRDGRETSGFEEGLSKEEERKQKGYEPIWWYKELSLYYKQVKHYLDVFGIERVKVLLYEEFSANPGLVLRDVFNFLEVSEDVAIDTSVRYNVSGSPKSRRVYNRLHDFIFYPSAFEKRMKSLVPQHLRVSWASKLIGMSVERVPLDPHVHTKLMACFAEDVRLLEDLLQRDLFHWQYRESSVAHSG